MSHRPSHSPSSDHGVRRAAAAGSSRTTPPSHPFGAERAERAPYVPTPIPTSSAAVSQADGDA